jgi:hypothetical protein
MSVQPGENNPGKYDSGRRWKVWSVVAVALIAGTLIGASVFGTLLAVPKDPQVVGGERNQALTISGVETIQVLAPNGKVVSTWRGPDPISGAGINALAACIPGSNGGSTTPVDPASVTGAGGTCSSFINAVEIVFSPASYEAGGTCTNNQGAQTENGFTVTGCGAIASATNTLTPLGCNPNQISDPELCSGWITQATFGPTTFTSTNCIYNISQTPCAVTEVDAGTLSQLTTYGHTEGFDYLNPTPIPVSAGDSLLVTIDFTIS